MAYPGMLRMISSRWIGLALLVALSSCAQRGGTHHGFRPAEIADREAIASAMNELYPGDLRAARIGGTAVVSFMVQMDGTTTDIEILASSGHEGLDRASVELVRGMSWHPALRNGVPEDQLAQLPVTWTP